MNDNNSSSSSPSKKRKDNDGRAAATDGAHDVSTGDTNDGGGFFSSWFGYSYFSGRSGSALSESTRYENSIQHSLSQINATMMRMEEKMTGMEEKLATVSRLERRCEQLEKKCSSLENMMHSTKKHIDQKCESLADRLENAVHKQEDKLQKCHEYNKMLIKNQSWKYSAPVLSVDDFIQKDYSEDEAEYLEWSVRDLHHITTQMRRGEFNSCIGDSGVEVEMNDEDPLISFEVNNELLPHWKEFAAALKQFTPAINLLPDNCESSFSFYSVQLNLSAMYLVRDALIGKPFKKLAFTNNQNGGEGMSVSAILDVVQSNKNLRKLVIDRNQIGSQQIERLCSAVRNHPLVELELNHCFEPGIGDEMLASLLSIDDLALEKLVLCSVNITTVGATLLADFLATNPRLEKLNLHENHLNDSDAELIANVFRSNTTLGYLDLSDNNITNAGVEALRLGIYDDSSLNAVADSNHFCSVILGWDYHDIDLDWIALDYWNSHEEEQVNRGRKIYYLLSLRNKTMCNTQHFGDIDVKILPDMLAAVQKYFHTLKSHNEYTRRSYFLLSLAKKLDDVKPLSIVYEAMRKWDKAFPLYSANE